MARTNQGGSILGFLVIGGVLAFLLVGGAYLVRNNLAPAGQEDEVAVQQDEGSENEEDETEQPAEDQTDGAESEPEQPAQEEEATEQPPQEETEQPTEDETPAPVPEEPAEEPLPVTGNQGDDDTPGSLPQTGMAGTLSGALMLGGLAALLVLYRRSRSLGNPL